MPDAAPPRPFGDAIRASTVPGQADEEPGVGAVVRRPPVLRRGDDLLDVALEGFQVERLELRRVIEVRAQRVARPRVPGAGRPGSTGLGHHSLFVYGALVGSGRSAPAGFLALRPVPPRPAPDICRGPRPRSAERGGHSTCQPGEWDTGRAWERRRTAPHSSSRHRRHTSSCTCSLRSWWLKEFQRFGDARGRVAAVAPVCVSARGPTGSFDSHVVGRRHPRCDRPRPLAWRTGSASAPSLSDAEPAVIPSGHAEP